MKVQIIYERSVNVLASGLAMAAQRLPFLKNLSPIFGSSVGGNFAAPLTVTFVGTHALSGQSITIQPTDITFEGEVLESTNPAVGTVGEEFVWAFRSSEFSLGSVKAEVGSPPVEGTPPGLEITGGAGSGGTFFLSGIPEEAGEYVVTITGWRFVNQRGGITAPYELFLTVQGAEEPLTPYEEFVATFWSGEDLNDLLLVGATADPDGDGISNEMEFVLDLDPTKPETMPGTFGVDPEDATKMRYEIPLNVAASAVAVSFEEGSDLEVDWQEVAAENVTRTDESILLSVPIEGKKFYRLKVVLGQN